MSKILLRIFFLILFLPLLAIPYSLQPNSVLTAQRTSLTFEIDGLLTDECWRQANWLSANHIISGSGKGGELSFAILYDDNNLYIGARIREEKPQVNHRKDEDVVWEDSCLEIFLDNPSPNKSIYNYRHYIVNADGYKLDEIGSKGAGSWNGNWEARTSRTADGWNAEIRIPASDLNVPSFQNTILPFNICASLYHPSHILISFSDLKGGYFHQPERFANLVLSEAPQLSGEVQLSLHRGDKPILSLKVNINKQEDLENIPSFSSLNPGTYALDVFKENRFLARYQLSVPYFPESFGSTIYTNGELTIWTADPMFNVFKETPPPQRRTEKISIFAGRNEWEPFQIIFRPNSEIRDFHLKLSDLKGPSIIPAKLIDIYKVEYVPITIPTDPDGKTGDFPDPLLKVEKAIDLEAGRNHPFWLELRIPSNAKAGIYKGEITAFSGNRKLASIPLELRVFNFSLPIKPDGFHIHTAYGMDVNLDYHKATPEDRPKILPFYLRLLADHHISPYNPFSYPIKYEMSPAALELSNGILKISFPKAGSTIAMLSLGDIPLANLSFCIDQRVGQNIGWPGLERVKPEIVIGGPLRYKLRVKGERVSGGAYKTEEEIEIFAGQKWISRRLLTLKSNAENPYLIAFYFLLLGPAQSGAEPLNGADWSSWKTAKGLASCFTTSPGKLHFSFWLDKDGGAHGDVTRDVNLEMEKGKEAINEPQPSLFIALTNNEEEMQAIKGKLSNPLQVNVEREGNDVIIKMKETAGIKREKEPVVVSLGEMARGWRYAKAFLDNKEIPSQLDGDELTLLVDLPANGEISVKVQKASSPWRGNGISLSEKAPSLNIDFSQFTPSAHYALDELGFSDYNICSALDMGWLWRNESITEEEKSLYKELGKRVEDFLRKQGWLKKAYCYWFDEPEEKDYPFVIKGMKLLKATFPNVRRLLTEQPEPPLYRYVDIWVPVLPNYNEERCKERQREGQEVWWYVCCGPRHPYPNNFIDYPGIEHRIRLWMNWKYKVTGDLYWSTTYWHKNPWQTPMSYWPDDKGMWGNGDGYLLYPPERGEAKEEFIGGPVPSMRIKMIREGIEDAEYLWMLEERIGKMKNPPSEAVSALNLARSLVKSLTEFCHSPEELQAVRLKVAEALERLVK